VRNLADGNFIIPQVGIIRSLNISVACAVTLYEAFRQKSASGHYEQRKLVGPAFDTLRDQWGFQLGEDERNEITGVE
jgi:tRNA (guanosine-2'-O-)-methyltransferase